MTKEFDVISSSEQYLLIQKTTSQYGINLILHRQQLLSVLVGNG
jgi:hypothetical protein